MKYVPTSRGLLSLSLIAIVVGVITGFGSILFRGLIGLIHNLFFLGRLTVFYDANVHTPPSPWGAFVILVPVIGGMGVVFLVEKFAPEARGHGVPEVMDAIYYKEGRIRPVVAAVKSLASALSIGSGAAVGREGPIIQIGASLGSTFGQLIRMETWQRITLVAAGAGAGIAATFNTPIGGVMFAIELMLPEVSVRTFLPVALATGTATFHCAIISWSQARIRHAADIRDVGTSRAALCTSSLRSARCGHRLGCNGFHSWSPFYGGEDFLHIRNPYLASCDRHAAGRNARLRVPALCAGHYYVEGVGYATIQDVLLGALGAAPLLATLFFAKLLATTLSLGSGSSGGIFSPSLFMGATLGGAFGALAHWVYPSPDINVAAFAIVGMAAMVGGGTGAAMTAVTMIFEMTRDYDMVMPLIIAVAVSIGITPLALAREYLHDQARRAKAFHPQGDARQYVSGAPCRRGDGQGHFDSSGSYEL
jgi:chloride channel protein, CIC family